MVAYLLLRPLKLLRRCALNAIGADNAQSECYLNRDRVGAFFALLAASALSAYDDADEVHGVNSRGPSLPGPKSLLRRRARSIG